jgi:hypothetical protein
MVCLSVLAAGFGPPTAKLINKTCSSAQEDHFDSLQTVMLLSQSLRLKTMLERLRSTTLKNG